jgi:hypothetical protein
VVFDALVDPRFKYSLLRAQMVALLAVTAGRFERVLVFGQPPELQAPLGVTGTLGPLYIPAVTPQMYTGKPRPTRPEADPGRPSRAVASRS